MTKAKHVVPERKMTRKGIELHGYHYQSSALRRLYKHIGAKSVRVKVFSDDFARIHVWHPYRSAWIEASFPKAEFWKNTCDKIVGELNSRVLE